MKRYIFIFSLIINVFAVFIIVRHYWLMPKNEQKKTLSFFVNRDRVLCSLPKDTTDILFVGDSQFQGFDVAEYFNDKHVKNRGIYYDNSAGVKYRSKDFARGRPKVVLIEIGINDLLQGVSPEAIKANVEQTVKTLMKYRPSVKIYVLSVLPTATVPEYKRLLVNKLYSTIKNVNFVNLDGIYKSNSGLNPIYDVGDNVHLNHDGYMRLTDTLKPLIN